VPVGGSREKYKLSGEWTNNPVADKMNEKSKTKNGGENASRSNYLDALVKVVNERYGNELEIKKKNGKYYLYTNKTRKSDSRYTTSENAFKLKDLSARYKNDLSRRYITSLLAKPFVILTGNSGTGKTRMAKQFAEYLEVEREAKTKGGDDSKEKNWLIVPVGADWTDNEKILGFFNPLANNNNGEYKKTEIVKLIELANDNPDIPYFIILDEMNLSYVERYFSDFLSRMETPDVPFEMDGYVREYEEDEHTEKRDKNAGKLKFSNNIYIVGTVNIDETTYMFSPKVLDRANVIEVNPQKKDILDLFTSSKKTGDEDNLDKNEKTEESIKDKEKRARAFQALAENVKSGRSKLPLKSTNSEGEKDEDSMEEVKKIFEKLYDILEKSEFEFAYRTVNEIINYISAAYEISDSDGEFKFSLHNAIDEQILQKVLPKIHGNTRKVSDILKKLSKYCSEGKIDSEDVKDKTNKATETNKEVAGNVTSENTWTEFEKSKEKIEEMKGKLDKVQYASFI
jgi:hypothetical protein